MSEAIIIALISSIVGGILVAIVNQLFTRKKTRAEVLKMQAEAEKIRAETTKLLGEYEFEITEKKLKQYSTPPKGWYLSGGDPTSYRVGIDREVSYFGNASGFIESIKKPKSTGTLMQKIRGKEYRGKRIRMSGYVKTQDVKDWAGLWFRVDGPDKYALSFDNMYDRPIKGTTDWQRYEIVLDVSDESVKLSYGVVLSGEGRVWVDTVKFEVVELNVPSTDLIEYKKDIDIQESPSNLDFES